MIAGSPLDQEIGGRRRAVFDMRYVAAELEQTSWPPVRRPLLLPARGRATAAIAASAATAATARSDLRLLLSKGHWTMFGH
jgi:hypothetical protein